MEAAIVQIEHDSIVPPDPFGVLYVDRQYKYGLSEEQCVRVQLCFIEELLLRLNDGFEIEDFLGLFDDCAQRPDKEFGCLGSDFLTRTKDMDDLQRAATLFCFLQEISWKITDQELLTAAMFTLKFDEWMDEALDILKRVLNLSTLAVA